MAPLDPSSSKCFLLQMPNLDETDKRLRLDVRTGATSSLYRSRILVFGGLTIPLTLKTDFTTHDIESEMSKALANATDVKEDYNDYLSNECFSLNLIERKWQHLKVKGDPESKPCPRFYHSMLIHDNYVFVHGGLHFNKETGKIQLLNDFWRFDMFDSTWKCMIENNNSYVLRRFNHKAIFSSSFLTLGEATHHGIFFNGGLNENNEMCYSVDSFDLVTSTFERGTDLNLFEIVEADGDQSSHYIPVPFRMSQNDSIVSEFRHSENPAFKRPDSDFTPILAYSKSNGDNEPIIEFKHDGKGRRYKLDKKHKNSIRDLKNIPFELNHPTISDFGENIIITGFLPNDLNISLFLYNRSSSKWARLQIYCSHNTWSHRFCKGFVWNSHHKVIFLGNSDTSSTLPSIQFFSIFISVSLPFTNSFGIESQTAQSMDDKKLPIAFTSTMTPPPTSIGTPDQASTSFMAYAHYVAPQIKVNSIRSVFPPYAVALGKNAFERSYSMSDFEFVAADGTTVALPVNLCRKRWGAKFDDLLTKAYARAFVEINNPSRAKIAYENEQKINRQFNSSQIMSSDNSQSDERELSETGSLRKSLSRTSKDEISVYSTKSGSNPPQFRFPFQEKATSPAPATPKFGSPSISSRRGSANLPSRRNSLNLPIPAQRRDSANLIQSRRESFNMTSSRRDSLNLSQSRRNSLNLPLSRRSSFTLPQQEARRGSTLRKSSIASTSSSSSGNSLNMNTSRTSFLPPPALPPPATSNISTSGPSILLVNQLPPAPPIPTFELPSPQDTENKRSPFSKSNQFQDSFASVNSSNSSFPLDANSSKNTLSHSSSMAPLPSSKLSFAVSSSSAQSPLPESIPSPLPNSTVHSSTSSGVAAGKTTSRSSSSINNPEDPVLGCKSLEEALEEGVKFPQGEEAEIDIRYMPRALCLPFMNSTVRAFSEFLYTGQVGSNWKIVPTAVEVLMMSKFYEVPLLYDLILEVLFVIIATKEVKLVQDANKLKAEFISNNIQVAGTYGFNDGVSGIAAIDQFTNYLTKLDDGLMDLSLLKRASKVARRSSHSEGSSLPSSAHGSFSHTGIELHGSLGLRRRSIGSPSMLRNSVATVVNDINSQANVDVDNASSDENLGQNSSLRSSRRGSRISFQHANRESYDLIDTKIQESSESDRERTNNDSSTGDSESMKETIGLINENNYETSGSEGDYTGKEEQSDYVRKNPKHNNESENSKQEDTTESKNDTRDWPTFKELTQPNAPPCSDTIIDLLVEVGALTSDLKLMLRAMNAREMSTQLKKERKELDRILKEGRESATGSPHRHYYSLHSQSSASSNFAMNRKEKDTAKRSSDSNLSRASLVSTQPRSGSSPLVNVLNSTSLSKVNSASSSSSSQIHKATSVPQASPNAEGTPPASYNSPLQRTLSNFAFTQLESRKSVSSTASDSRVSLLDSLDPPRSQSNSLKSSASKSGAETDSPKSKSITSSLNENESGKKKKEKKGGFGIFSKYKQ